MKKNPGESKALLEKALASMPDDFALSEARSHIRRAMESITRVEMKRGVRQRTQDLIKREQEMKKMAEMDRKQAMSAINQLDKLIKLEQDNMGKVKDRPSPTTRIIPLND